MGFKANYSHLWSNTLSLLCFSLLLPVAGSIVSLTLLEAWRFEHMLSHSAVELIGSLISFAIIYLILVKKTSISQTESEITWTVSALIMMGMYDLIHAIMPVGQHFVLFHSLATFFGGALFAGIWMKISNTRCLRKVPLMTFLFALLSSSFFILNTIFVPIMVIDQEFTTLAQFLNVIGGINYVIAFLYLYKRYVETQKRDYYLLSAHCLLFGMAGILFELSAIWDAAWWWWHMLRLAAYMILMVFFFKETKPGYISIQFKLISGILAFAFTTLLALCLMINFVIQNKFPDFQLFTKEFYQTFIGYLLLVVVGIVLLCAYLARAIAEKITVLSNMIERIQSGETKLRAKIYSNDEIELLANGLVA